nr:hypothetical protein [Tanacetum cinerariifolium]
MMGKVVGSVWEGRRVVGSGDSGVAGNGGKQVEQVKEKQEKDKIGTKSDNNGKRGKARQCQSPITVKKAEKENKYRLKRPKMQTLEDMTTSVGNNLVFRSFFEKQKPTGPNFIDWYRQLRIVLSVEDKENYLEHPIPVALVAAPGHQVPPQALAAHAAWAEHELLQTVREFHACKQEEGQSVSSYFLKMKSYINNLERLGQPVSLRLTMSLILVSLSKEAQRVEKNQKKKPHKVAKGNQEKVKAKTGYALVRVPSFVPKPKNPSPPKKDNHAKDAICHQCGEVGHWRRNYPVYLVELPKKKKLS